MSLKEKSGRSFIVFAFCLIVIAISAAFFLIKRQKPLYVVFKQVGIRSSNRIPEIARAGDVVTLSFSLDTNYQGDFPLMPAVDINGIATPVTSSGDFFLASRTLSAAEQEGPISFSIDLYNVNGKSISEIESTTDGSSVAIDKTPPSLEEVIVSTANLVDPTRASFGDRVTVSIRSSEPLGDYPDMFIAGVLPDTVQKLDPHRFRAEAVLSEKLKAGPLPLRIEYTDRAGNSGPVFTAGEDSQAPVLIYDPDPPKITHIGIASTNPESKRIARLGDMVILSFSVSEQLAALPIIEIPGARNIRVTQINTPEGMSGQQDEPMYEAVAQMMNPIPSGRINFAIAVMDMAGNTQVLANETTDGSSVYFRSPSSPILALESSAEKSRIPFIGSSYGDPEHLGYIEAIDPGGTMDLTIHFSLSIAGTTPFDEETEAVEEPAVTEPVVTEPVVTEASVAETKAVEPETDISADKPEVEQIAIATEPDMAKQIGTESPIIIDSPKENSFFGSHVQVAGRILDPESVTLIRWEVSPLVFLGQESEFLSGETNADEYGVFSFIFATEKVSGSQQVVVTAVYNDDREEEVKLSLLEGESAIPTFAVANEGESALVSWEPNPIAASYSLEYKATSKEGSNADVIEGIVSPSRIKGLELGNRYTFLLHAYEKDGTFAGSSLQKEIVALFPNTLKPKVASEYKRIRVTWPEIAGAENFDIERSVDSDNDFQLLEEAVPGTEYIDTDVTYGKNYFYRVSPGGVSYYSDAEAGEPLAVPEEKTRVAVSWQDIKVSDATVFGSYTFVAAGADGLVIFDISNPEKPVNISSLETNDAHDVAVNEGYAYVADSDRGIRVIDIDSPLRPVEVGSRKTSDARSIELLRIDDETLHAIVADGTYGVKVLDVSNPKDPERIFSIATTEASDLIIFEKNRRHYAIVADGPGGVVIIDLDVPDPAVVSSFKMEYASGLSIQENLLFVADLEKGLKILNLEDIKNPELVSSYDLERAIDVAVSDDYAYIASDTEGLLIFDVNSPTLPVFYDAAKIEGLRAVAVKGTKVFAGGDKGFHLLDAFTRGESYEISSVQTDGKAYEVSISKTPAEKTLAYVADRAGGLKIFDVTAPDTLGESSLLAHVETEYCREALAVGDYIYIADGPGGLLVADLSSLWDDDPETQPSIIGKWDTDGNARSLAYADSLIYVADGNRGVKIIDVANPNRPTQVGSVRTEYAVNIRVANGLIYLADGDGGFRIYDANPENPLLLAEVDTANTRGVDIVDSIAYVVGSTGLSIIDVSSPAEPTVVGFYQTGYAEEVAVENDLAFIAEGFNGLTIIDVYDPTSPYIVSKSENRYTVGVTVSGKYAYLVDTAGLKIVEILIPSWAMRR